MQGTTGQEALKTAKKAFLSGIPTAIAYDIVKVGEDYGSVFEMLNARTFHELVQDGELPLEEVLHRYISLLKQVHHTTSEKGAFTSWRDILILKMMQKESRLSGGLRLRRQYAFSF